MFIRTWVSDRCVLKSKWNESDTSRKTAEYLLPMVTFELSNENLNFWKFTSATVSFIDSQYFSGETGDDNN